MSVARRVMRWLVNSYREMDRGLAVMRGEESVAGLARYTRGVDWSRKRGRGSASGRLCRRGRSER